MMKRCIATLVQYIYIGAVFNQSIKCLCVSHFGCLVGKFIALLRQSLLAVVRTTNFVGKLQSSFKLVLITVLNSGLQSTIYLIITVTKILLDVDNEFCGHL